jgi:purine-binding chemotaxis protein CheW
VPLDLVLEVDRVPRVTRVPGAPASLRGIVNLRGEIVPLLDLRAMLELPPPPAGSSGRLVVVRMPAGDSPCALQVDALGGIALLDSGSLETPAPELDSRIAPWVTGASAHRNRPVQLFDLNRLLAAQPEWAAEA